MDNLIAELKSNPELKREFVEFMHKEEAQFSASLKVVQDGLNKQVMQAFVDFAKQKGIAIKDSEKVKEEYTAACKKIAAELDKFIVEKVLENIR